MDGLSCFASLYAANCGFIQSVYSRKDFSMNLSLHDTLKMRLGGRHCAVLGIGISNTPLIDFLLDLGATVSAYDQKSREALGDLPTALESKGVTLTLGPAAFDEITADVIFKSPGIRPDVPGILRAVEAGAELTSEMQIFFEYCPCHTVAITGSDGKTTTTTLIAKILEADGKRVFLGGNIGAPLLPRIYQMTADDFAVAELSSFQLQVMTRAPEVAVITNITPTISTGTPIWRSTPRLRPISFAIKNRAVVLCSITTMTSPVRWQSG